MSRLRLSVIVEYTRPFTLLPPMLGMISGAFTALGAMRHRNGWTAGEALAQLTEPQTIVYLLLGSFLAASLNAGSNILNQWADLENDRINKPHRPLVTGRVTVAQTFLLVAIFYGLTMLAAALIRPDGRHDTFWIVLGGAIATILYSVPPFRTKRFGIWANITIASARGCLLKVCGWSCIAAATGDREPWWVGGLFMFWLVGAASTKDFSDIEGDRAAHCRTWPVVYGPRKAAWMVAPFLVVPWLLIPLGTILPGSAHGPLMSARPTALIVLSAILAVYGLYVAKLILADPDALARTENHPSWKHMYLQMMVAQIGFAVAYWI